ncbi:sugar phosphate isomerase/epimerase [Hellea sp.]|nr:sugar phosphate isomerase/epimerase [Hellea sp.]
MNTPLGAYSDVQSFKSAVSNIAWSFDERFDAYDILQKHGYSGVEIAPGLLFQDCETPLFPNATKIKTRISELQPFGLSFCSMQSLFFGVQGAALFEDAEKRATMGAALRARIDLASSLGIVNLVFGSPKIRNIPSHMTDMDAQQIAEQFFRELGDYAGKAGCKIALEANPKVYGTNFMNTFSQTADLAKAVQHPAISVNFDVGSFIINEDDTQMADMFQRHDPLVSHVHVSQPQLAPAPDDLGAQNLVNLLRALKSSNYENYISIEMKRSDDELTTLRDKAAKLKNVIASVGSVE